MEYLLIYYSIGDWGANNSIENAAQSVAVTINNYSIYINPIFIVSLGDNFYENGVIMQKGSFNIDGLPHGEWASFNMDGKELCSGNYKNGLRVGVWNIQLDKEIQSVYYFNSKIINAQQNDSDLASL